MRWDWVLLGAVVFLLMGTLAWWSAAYSSCSGQVVRGVWNQPVCVEAP